MLEHFVFVYGTLKKNQPNYQWMEKSGTGTFQFVGTGRLAEKYFFITFAMQRLLIDYID